MSRSIDFGLDKDRIYAISSFHGQYWERNKEKGEQGESMQVTVGNLTQEELVKAVKVKETILEGMSIIERIPGIMINREWAAFSFMPCRNSHQEEIRIMVILGTSLSTVELDPYIKEAASEEIRNGLCLVLTDRRAEEINVVIRTPDSSFDGFICP